MWVGVLQTIRHHRSDETTFVHFCTRVPNRTVAAWRINHDLVIGDALFADGTQPRNALACASTTSYIGGTRWRAVGLRVRGPTYTYEILKIRRTHFRRCFNCFSKKCELVSNASKKMVLF